ncbi:hypothetical protein ACI48D_14340 [Massilia sp. LXY-6]|uniref:hypothetical protein n=1 Tax=Massilia sp. LXY-6 TaxID=3379823 RepID=UPI003EE1AE4B
MGTRKTVCVGRYLVDVPVQTRMSFAGNVVNGFEVGTFTESETVFREQVAAREAEIVARGAATDGSGGMFEARDLRIPGMIGRTRISGRNGGYWMEKARRNEDELLSAEVHAHTGSLSLRLSAKYGGEARARSVEALLARLRLSGEGEIPDEPEVCIDHAFFVEPLPARKIAHIPMHLGFAEHPDLTMAFVTMPGYDSGSSLLALWDGIASSIRLRPTRRRGRIPSSQLA